jgi:hypothetical protein
MPFMGRKYRRVFNAAMTFLNGHRHFFVANEMDKGEGTPRKLATAMQP